MTAPGPTECPGCGRPVLQLTDVDTDEQLTVDPEPLPVATVEVFRAGPAIAGRRRGTPGRAPVHQEHTCAWTTAISTASWEAAVDDAYTPEDPGLEQAGWRAP